MPQRTTYIALHTDYSEEFCPDTDLPEDRCGEIAVKRLLEGNRGHYGCYSADTSVMTSRGWVPWPDVVASDELLAVDLATGEGHFEVPKRLFSQELLPEDLMYHVCSDRLDMMVTHDHRMITSRRVGRGGQAWSPLEVTSAASVAGKAVRYLKTAELIDSQRSIPADLDSEYSTIDALRVAGFYFGDGVRSSSVNARCLRFRLRRPRKISFLEEHGQRVGLLEPMSDDRFTLRCGALASWVEKHFRREGGKTVPPWLLTLPRAELLAFLDGLRNSDGTSKNGVSWALDSCELESLRLIQAAATLNGIAANLTLNNPNLGEGHENHRPCWRLHFSHDRQFARFEACHQRTRGTEEAVPYQGKVYCATVSTGALLVCRNGKSVVSGNCLEHSHLSLLIQADHNTMMQLRTHRVGLSFDLQSQRYSGIRFEKVASGELPVEKAFHFRPPGRYHDRQGDPYDWTEEMIQEAMDFTIRACELYRRQRKYGVSEEHARGIIPTNYFQNGMITGNIRSWFHLLDVRSKLDAQLEARWTMDLVQEKVEAWVPEIYAWYQKNRLGKARLAP